MAATAVGQSFPRTHDWRTRDSGGIRALDLSKSSFNLLTPSTSYEAPQSSASFLSKLFLGVDSGGYVMASDLRHLSTFGLARTMA